MKLRLMGMMIAGVLLAACSKAPPPPPAANGGDTANAPANGSAAAPAPEEKVLNFYNWSDYIAEDTIPNFTKETGIKVTYDVFDENETLETKLMAGHSGYDLVVPSSHFIGRQITAGLFLPLDKSKLTNYGNLDPDLMKIVSEADPGNQYAIPWLWGTTGIGYNVDKVKAALGPNAPVDSLDLVFQPKYMSKLKCGVSMLDSPTEIFPIVLKYLGEDPNSTDPAVIQKAKDQLQKVRPYITYFHSSQYINDLANGDICVAIGWSGDVFMAASRANDAKNKVHIEYSIPKEGAPIWFDMLAIPKDAKHPENALTFMNYYLRPEVVAKVTEFVSYANANKASTPLVSKEILDNPSIYPTPEVRKKLFPLKVLPPDADRVYTRLWTELKTGK